MHDLRTPIGSFFSVVGILLLITAFASTTPAPLGSEHINLYCGASMLVFGSVMLWLARRAL